MSTATRTAHPSGAARTATAAVAVGDRPRPERPDERPDERRVVVLDLARATRQYRELRDAFPWVDLHYDVSALCHPVLLDTIAASGGAFEASHRAALSALERRRIDLTRVLFSPGEADQRDALHAYRAGVRLFVVDGPPELDRLAGLPADARVLVRLRPALAPRPAHRASSGILLSDASDVVRLSAARGVSVAGFSLHLPTDASVAEYVAEIGRASAASADVAAVTGRRPALLDLGDGFPGAAAARPYLRAELARAIRSVVAPATSGTALIASVGGAVTAGCITIVERTAGGDLVDADADPARASECIDAGAEVVVLREGDRSGLLSRLPLVGASLFRANAASRHRTVRPPHARRTWTPAG